MIKIKATYLFPNGIIVTFDDNDQQMEYLQGRFTDELFEEIICNSDTDTEFYGYEKVIQKLYKNLLMKKN